MNRKHPFWKHKLKSSGTVTVDLMPSRETTEVPADLPSPPEADVNSSPTTPENESTVCSSQVLQDDDSPVSDPRATAAKFLLMLKERHNMTQTAISFAIDSVKRLVTCTCNELIATAAASGVGIDAENVDSFCGLETEYFQTKYYKEHLGLVVSNRIIDLVYCNDLPCTLPLLILI